MSEKRYDPELKKKILRLHLEEGRTIRSLTDEYKLGTGTLKYWLNHNREECATNTETEDHSREYAIIQELKKRNAELEKENRFLKKAAAFFAKEIDE